MPIGITMRPDGAPDVYVMDSGAACNLHDLEKKIRALLVARAWLKKELALHAKEQKKSCLSGFHP